MPTRTRTFYRSPELVWLIDQLDRLESSDPPVAPPRTPPHEDIRPNNNSVDMFWIWPREDPDVPGWFGHGYRIGAWMDEPGIVELARQDFVKTSFGEWDTSFIRRRALLMLDPLSGAVGVRRCDPTRPAVPRDVRAGLRMVLRMISVLSSDEDMLKKVCISTVVALTEWRDNRPSNKSRVG